MDNLPIDPESVLDSIQALLLSFALALPTAWLSQRGVRRLGLRTIPLVAMASCGFVLIGLSISRGDPNAISRVLQGLMTGIGFVGGGAIVKSESDVQGVSIAASVWATGGVGAAVATGRLELAIAIALLTFLTLLILTPVRERIRDTRGTNTDG